MQIEITQQERICLECLRQGKSQEATAILIFRSVSTVERTYRELRERFECENNYQLLAFAYENHLINLTKESLSHRATSSS